ncbi:MAG: hypothetical protein GY842_05895 [bacterium]|nr:hypothetical protein [bacterium]
MRVPRVVRLVSVIPLLAGGLLLCGCESPPARKDQTARLIPNHRPYERDVPLPVGFSIVEPAMEDYSTGQSRTYLRHTYAGRADKFAVRRFYQEQMPLQRWVKVSDGAIKGEFSLRFAKGGELCDVDIHDEWSILGKRTVVQVKVAQEERGSLPPLAQNRP